MIFVSHSLSDGLDDGLHNFVFHIFKSLIYDTHEWSHHHLLFSISNKKDASYSSHNGSSGTTTSTSSSLLYSTPGTSTMPAVSTSSSSALFGTSAGTSSHLQRLTTSSSLSAGLTGSSSLLLPPVSPLSLPALPLDALNSVGKITHHLFSRKQTEI